MKRALLLIALIPLFIGADHCRVVVRSHHNHHQRAVVIQQVVPAAYYSVGAAIQEDALAERVASLVLQKLAASGVADGTVAASEATAAPSLLVQSCAKCHSGPEAKNGFDVTLDLTCEQRLKAIGRVLADDPARRMPKGGTLEPELLGQVIQELSSHPIGE